MFGGGEGQGKSSGELRCAGSVGQVWLVGGSMRRMMNKIIPHFDVCIARPHDGFFQVEAAKLATLLSLAQRLAACLLIL